MNILKITTTSKMEQNEENRENYVYYTKIIKIMKMSKAVVTKILAKTNVKNYSYNYI